MPSSETEITNLLYRYAELMDAGDLPGAADLFAHAQIRRGGPAGYEAVDHARLLAQWQHVIVIYDDGTPRTKHVVTNPIVEVDEDAGRATCRSYYTVMQKVEGSPLQAVICGRYHDRFERVGGKWRFAFRDYTLTDLVGDLSRHVPGALG
jgi:3-phenylpropionate/cinnamic acid dioxygenase small subunit